PAPPVNQRPVVNAGPDQTITLPSSASLTGSASDDGLPNPPGALVLQWSKLSGPGTTTFANAGAASTTASFSQAGTYVLRLSANDSLRGTTDDITVTVNPAPPVNQRPVVNAGPDQTITLPSSASLNGTASDDGLPNPPGALVLQWSKLSGPGTATFANASAASTTVSFSQAGTYVLRLSASDSLLSTTDDITVTVNPASPLVTANITSPATGATFTAPANINISATASSSAGSITRVDFFQGANLLGTATTSPYIVPWNNVASGNYVVTARATDSTAATGTSSPVNIVVSSPLAPANDAFVGAQMLSGNSGTVTGSNVNATKQPGEPFHAGNSGGHSIWYQWIAPASSQTTIDTLQSGFNTLLAVYTGSNVSSLTQVGSNNDINQTTVQSRLSFTSVTGTTYWIAVDGFNGASGNVVLRWEQTFGPPPPANDGFATAPLISGSVGSFTANNSNATKEPGEPDHAGNPGGRSVWYQWTAPVSNPTTFDTFGSAFDTLLGIYTGNSVGALTQVTSNNDLDTVTKTSRLTFTPGAGTTYFIAVDGLNAASGNFVLSWSQSGLGYLPDLTIWANSASNYQIANQTFLSTDCAVVEGMVQAGTRKLLLFTTETRNVGAIDWWLGNPVNNPSFVWAPCHAHYHFNGFMQYRLLNGNGQLIAPGAKVGFCLTDSLRWDSTANVTPKYHCGNQGIQRGWGDVYTYVTSGQWIEITGVPDGYYVLEMTVNPQGLVQESDYSNNIVQIPVVIGQPGPANDNFSSAFVLAGSSGSFNGLNSYASLEVGEPAHAGNAGGHSIWFSWTAPDNQPVIVDTLGSSINTLLGVYTGSSVNNLSLVATNDDIGGVYNNLRSRVIFNPGGGTVYRIAVDGYNGAVGNVTLNLKQSPPPANDLFANAQAITGGAGTVTGDNLLATKETGEPSHTGNAGGHSIWYKWSAPLSGSATIDTVGSDFDTMMAVYTGASVSGLTLIGSNDDIGGTPNSVLSRVSFNANGGTAYLIAVDGYNGKRGYVTLNWSQPSAGLGTARPANNFLVQKFDLNKAVQPVLACSPMSTGGVLIRLQGEPNERYTIDCSTDLVGWTLLYNLTTDIEGRGILVDRSKPAGRVNLLDPWCGSVDNRIYDSRQNRQGVYYRVVSSPQAGQADEQSVR
ncbi:MAG: lysyl oxidase family protein, partial [Verrucomicrobiota bacterium]